MLKSNILQKTVIFGLALTLNLTFVSVLPAKAHNTNDISREEYKISLNDRYSSNKNSHYLNSQVNKINEEIKAPTLKTGKSRMMAAGISIVLPGAGQFYNGDYVMGAVFLGASLGLIILDWFVPYAGLVGYPGVNLISALHAGLTTQEEIQIKGDI